jgi:apolipoprotein N-acyltransferase
MSLIKSPFAPLTLSMLSGILLGTSTIPFQPWALFFCLCPLMWLWLKESPLKVFLYTALSFFIASLIGFFWLSSLLQKFAGLSLSLSILVLFFFCFFYHITLAILGYVFVRWIKPRTKHPILALCACFSLVWLNSPMLFPWDFSINWIYGGLKAYEFLDIFGAQGLHSITVFLNGAFLFSLLRILENKDKKPLLFTLIFLVAFNTLGWLYAKIPQKMTDKSVNITLVQGNIGNIEEAYQKYGDNFRTKVLDIYLDLSAKAVTEKTKLLIWPETAYPAVYYEGFQYNFLARKTFSFLKNSQTDLLTGMFYQNKAGKTSNAAVLFTKDGGFLFEPVKKQILLAFGEYLPGERWFPFLRKMMPMVGDFERGSGPQVRQINDLNFGILICYESLFESFSRSLADQKAQVLVNLTNDSWYGPYSEPEQHLYSLVARAIETRLPILRATNTGISTLIMPNGEVQSPSPLNTPWSKDFNVPYLHEKRPTFYQRFGHHLTLPVLLIMVILCVTYGKKRN